MADDIANALQQANRSASVLQGIANPPQVNPLAAITAGNQAAQQEFQTRQARMQTGAMQSALIASQTMTLARNGSDENLAASFANLRASNVFPQQVLDQEYARWQAMSKPEREANAERVGIVHLDQLSRVLGTTSAVNTGGQIEPYTLRQPSPEAPAGSFTRGTGGAITTASPEAVLGMPDVIYPATEQDVREGRAASTGADVRVSGADRMTRFGLGGLLPPGAREVPGTGGGGGGRGPAVVRDSQGNPVSPANPPRLLKVPGQPAAPAAAPAPAVVPPPAPAPTAPAVVAPAPVAPATTSAPTPPPVAPAAPTPSAFPKGAALQGGAQVASANPLQVPTTGAPGAPNALVPGDVADIQAGMAQARATPRPAGTQTAYNTMSVGPGVEEAQGYKASADKLAADRLEAANFQQTQFPYVQALKNYGEGTKTGPTTDFWNQVAGSIRTPLAKLGMNIGPLADTTERVDALGKWLASIQSANPISAHSDAMLAQTLKGSASTHINEVAGEDMVKAGLILKRMNVAATNEWLNNPAVRQQHGTYLTYLNNFNTTVDPRAFGVDMYNPAQKKRLTDQIRNGTEEDAVRFKNTLDMARRNGMISGAGSQAMP